MWSATFLTNNMSGKFEDDNRTIADMSGVERPSVFGGLSGIRIKKNKDSNNEEPEVQRQEIPKEERKWYIFGTLKAALLIAGAFIVGLGLFIALLCWIY